MQVLLADEHPLIRHGLTCLLAEHFPGLSFLQAGSLGQAMRLLGDGGVPTDLMVLDPLLAGIDPFADIARLREAHPAMRIVVLTGRADRATILASTAAGANGFLLKTDSMEALLDGIRAVLPGHVRTPAQQAAGAAPPPGLAGLTARQREVLTLLVDGRSTKDIARRLNLGLGTVKVHLNGVYQRLGARNRGEAVARARQMEAR